jgi:hypothetical protein
MRDPSEAQVAVSQSRPPQSKRERMRDFLFGKVGAIGFRELMAAEYTWLDERRLQVNDKSRAQPLVCDGSLEPWVSATTRDTFGLALSGGGIRSATFNLGLMQALAREVDDDPNDDKAPRSILDLVDYLATVSGGGYIGGFWSRWLCDLAERRELDAMGRAIFPQAERSDERLTQSEAGPIRHLRERSRFLIPRIGLFESQTWTGVVALVGALLPSLVIAGAALVLVWLAWQRLFSSMVASDSRFGGMVIFGVLSLAISTSTEVAWRRRSDSRPDGGLGYALSSIAIALASAEGLWLWNNAFANRAQSLASLFGPACVWLIVALGLLLVARPALSRLLTPSGIQVLERLTARCLAPALVWAILAGTWRLAERIGHPAVMPAAAATGTAAGLLVAIRDWLNKPIQETHGTQLLDRVMAVIKPLAPQLLAYTAFLGMLWLAAVLVLDCQKFELWVWVVSTAIVIGAVVLLDPKRVGLHEFYRSRIAATFLGGYRPSPNTSTAAQVSYDYVAEDITLGQLARVSRARRPIHLVCTTANHLSGDALSKLYRGGRSATLSPIAFSVGNVAVADPHVKLSSALTASAAAFNSQMGSFSKRLGPAVAFIMSSLGLRLGLWLRHPSSARGGLSFPGLYFFAEMLGYSDCDKRNFALHLSDGGHFENLALYELVRRHCRYILVSDCGADSDIAFDDLANATRRIREDFGIEIELDTEPLRPNAVGLSQQHAVVGTVHYDGLGGSDKGIIIYFKPSLVGDEPTDVFQYRKRNQVFPHEGTGDQFYDEAQWESYRRLGEHCGRTFFRFLDDAGLSKHGNAVERLFLGAIERWQRVRGTSQERGLELVRERDELLGEIRAQAPLFLQRELYSELASPEAQPKLETPKERELLDALHYCVRLTTFMDRVYHLVQLETTWSQGSNQIWMTFFGRCAAAATLRHWWPLLRPWCSNGLRDFMRNRFEIRIAEWARTQANNENAVVSMHLRPAEPTDQGALLYASDRWIARFGEPLGGSLLRYIATFQGVPQGAPVRELGVGILSCREQTMGSAEQTHWHVAWSSPELFVPEALNGAGFSSRFLDAVIAHFQERAQNLGQRVRLSVNIEDEPISAVQSATLLRDPAHRQARRDTLHFYKSRGFEQSTLRHDLEAESVRRTRSSVGSEALALDLYP